jgi:thiol:disulfide interchange protein DsbD
MVPFHIGAMRALLAALAGVFLLTAAPASAQPVDTGHLKAELVAQDSAVAPGSTIYVALRQEIDEGWHTYWRNPGDSGEPTKLAWTLPAGWQAGEIVWATPSRLPFGPLTNYGYSGEVLLPVAIQVPAGAAPGSSVTLRAKANFLVCEKICIPEEADLSLTVRVDDGAPTPDARWGAPIAKALADAPKPAGLAAGYRQQGETLELAVTGTPLKGLDLSGAYFFPFEGVWIDHARPQGVEQGPEGLTLSITPGYAFEAGQPPEAMGGVLVLGDRAFEISAPAGALPDGAAGLGPPAPTSAARGDGGGTGGAGGLGLLAAMGLAFLGGMILNLMPCVFPVLSMKAAALAGHAHETRAARTHGLAYGLGAVVTFLALAGLLIGLKAAGAAAGWGFQLQSPPVVAALAVLMLAVAMNLSGVFEIGQGLQGAGSGLASRQGLAGAFFTGALAVVVASPCTAPFMASALGYTLTAPPLATLAVFLALGVGFALPFVLLSFAPPLLRLLPRPGAWMDVLRKALAFPMYGAVAWLVWVLAQQTDAMGLAVMLAVLVLAGFSLWLFGLGQGHRRPVQAAGGVGLALAAGLAALSPYPPPAQIVQPAADGEGPAKAELTAEAWSPERLAAARAEGRPVLVNFTAAWCVTCKVNEQVALSTLEVSEALKASGAVYLKGDWTRRDAVIAKALAEHGRAGVPLYLLYTPGADKPRVLPQLLTPGLVAQALREATTPTKS